MPRIPRNLIIDNDKQVHKIWRGHNKEWNISSDDEKRAYFEFLNKELERKGQKNILNAFGTMSNHSHEMFDILDREKFSDLMRNHHSRYGMFFNRKHKRCGKVAYERAKTCLIESDEYSMRAIFYIHTNPVRAGIVKDAKDYMWSTHRLYAYGKREPYMKYVQFPGWYMELGATWELRRKRYRQLFDQYLRNEGLIKQAFLNKNFFGSHIWMYSRHESLVEYQKTTSINSAISPPE